MSNHQPHFTFNVNPWLTGTITKQPYDIQGVFINVCAYYYQQNCQATLLLLNIRLPNASEQINKLIEVNLIKHDKASDKIVIAFLDHKFKQQNIEKESIFSLIKEWTIAKLGNIKNKIRHNNRVDNYEVGN